MSRFMEQIHIGRFGALEDYRVGPFERGLNVVYGPNEAGKSTIASFVGGVLFGWEEAHGVRNTYSPATGERFGELVFSDGTTASRESNEDGLKGDAHPTNDIDSATFKTMFSLTSDELRSLRNSSDVTARLLTAGSGTGTSPAGAFVEIEQRIAALTSRSPEADGSIFNLAEQLDAEHELVRELGDEAERRIREDWELQVLREDREITARHLSDVNREIEKLGSSRARIERVDAQADEARAELSSLEAEYSGYAAEHAEDAGLDSRLMLLDNTADRSLRDKLDEYADEQAKATRGVDIAKENAAASSAAYEALMEMDADSPQVKRARRSKTSLAVLPALLTLAFALGGVPVFVHGRAINSLSLTALGIGLIVFACLLAVTTVALVARPDRTAEALDARKQDAQWVMLQDKKKLDASMAAKQLLDDEVGAFLEEKGLAAANGSIRQARSLLDDAREVRSDMQVRNQRLASLEMRIETDKQTIGNLARERAEILADVGFESSVSIGVLEEEIEIKESQREALSRTCDEMSVRMGELAERLEAARNDRSFDIAKIRHQQTRVRLREAKHELISLLLAKRMLEKSIAAWESRSQPEVYRKASELFSEVTGGAWTQISMTAEGRLVAISHDGAAREVRHLSLGTCQQLYLSLRVAMLLHADNVGRAIPVLADDILVNFDATRRRAAARILAELAECRQVIVFTCHQETVEALREAQPELNYLVL